MHRSPLLLLGVVAVTVSSLAAAPPDGAEVYRMACAACHGIDGRGTPATATSLEVELPDLTDCSFATREADADWLSVVHQGGPGRAFAREMPAFGAALTRPQMQAAIDHARTFCTDTRWPRGELNLPRTLATEKAYPEDEAVITTAAALSGPGSVSNKLIYEQRVGPRSQVEIIVPFAWREEQRPGERQLWSGGVGDMAIGAKHVVFHSLARGSIVSIAGEVILPTGHERRGFGRDKAAVEPFVAFGQLLPADSFLQLQAGAELPLGGAAADEAFFRLAFGRIFTPRPFGRRWTPMIELLASRELESGAVVHWDAIPQLQVPLSRRQHVLACAGVRVALNDSNRSEPQLVLYLLWDWFDGGLTDGW